MAAERQPTYSVATRVKGRANVEAPLVGPPAKVIDTKVGQGGLLA
jgi:hypothetical protein